MVNNICERVLEHWKNTGKILPELSDFKRAEIEEVIDGINDKEEDLISALWEFRLCCG